MFGKIIFHIDVNSAFLSWEATYRLYHKGGNVDLREQVSAVGGDVTMRHGIILAKSIPAKQYNIKTGESLMEAKQKCPDLIIVPPYYNLYEQCSSAFMRILREYSDTVEQYEYFTSRIGSIYRILPRNQESGNCGAVKGNVRYRCRKNLQSKASSSGSIF